MRFKIDLEFNGNLELPLNYNKILQGFIYRNIMDEKLAEFMHDEGFAYKNEKRKYKMFTYSRILGIYCIDRNRKKIIYKSPVQLIVSSCFSDFFIDLSLSLLQRDVEIAGHKCHISKMDIILEEPKSIQKIRMLSPVTVYSTLADGRTVYYSPGNQDFKRIIKENIIKKYTAFFDGWDQSMKFTLETLGNRYNKVINLYDGFIIEGWMGDFILKGSLEMLKLAYDTGIGSKNSQGFGCFELI